MQDQTSDEYKGLVLDHDEGIHIASKNIFWVKMFMKAQHEHICLEYFGFLLAKSLFCKFEIRISFQSTTAYSKTCRQFAAVQIV